MAINRALPRDLEAQVFGYLDELHRRRVAAGSGSPLEPETPQAPAGAPEPQG
ncbi:MAG: hypothetical protein MUF54_10590 [Polyangiaceae bacterium]|nr:hypothetical protein [Polyangiaceae bacterium]